MIRSQNWEAFKKIKNKLTEPKSREGKHAIVKAFGGALNDDLIVDDVDDLNPEVIREMFMD